MSLYNSRFDGSEQIHVAAYSSIGEVLEVIKNPQKRWISNAQSSNPDYSNWYQTKNLEEATTMLRDGWHKGRDLLIDGINVSNVNTSQLNAPHSSLDVAGACPFIPAVVAGDPLNMWALNEDANKTKPVVAFYQRLFYSSRVRSEHILNLGSAIISMIDKLEGAGYPTEIYVYNSTAKNFFTVKLKDAGEPLNIDRLAFPIAHPSMFRRIAFRLTETDPRLEYEPSYGYASNPREGYIPENSVVIPTTELRVQCETVSNACNYVKSLIQQSPWASSIEIE